MNVQYLKLISGEDVIAEVIDPVQEQGESDVYVLKNPARVVFTQEGVGLGPLVPFGVTKEMKVAKSHVVYTSVPVDEFTNGYNAQFGSGIVVPPPGAAAGLNLVGDD